MRKSKKSDDVLNVVDETTVKETSEVSEPVLNGDAETIKEFLQNVLDKMQFSCKVEEKESGEVLSLEITGEDASHAIGYRGETLDALQYMCNLLLGGKESGFKRVTLDAEDYRAKREKILQRLAGNLEQKVKRTGREVKLEPMNPYERRIIHTSLQGSKYVTTASEGQGSARHVVISPIGQSDILNAPNAPRKTLNFVYRSEKKRRR
ncbi:MAG: protein jag [Clostridia bacterium]|nr:protein jag [Clostridia bacterium]